MINPDGSFSFKNTSLSSLKNVEIGLLGRKLFSGVATLLGEHQFPHLNRGDGHGKGLPGRLL